MYQLQYQPLQTMDETLTVNITGLATNLTVHEGFVSYSFSVRAYTNVGAGPYSDNVTVMLQVDGKIFIAHKMVLFH